MVFWAVNDMTCDFVANFLGRGSPFPNLRPFEKSCICTTFCSVGDFRLWRIQLAIWKKAEGLKPSAFLVCLVCALWKVAYLSQPLPAQPNWLMSSLARATIASVPGFMTLRGS